MEERILCLNSFWEFLAHCSIVWLKFLWISIHSIHFPIFPIQHPVGCGSFLIHELKREPVLNFEFYPTLVNNNSFWPQAIQNYIKNVHTTLQGSAGFHILPQTQKSPQLIVPKEETATNVPNNKTSVQSSSTGSIQPIHFQFTLKLLCVFVIILFGIHWI